MTLDALDQAFVTRWEQRAAVGLPTRAGQAVAEPAAPASRPAPLCPAPPPEPEPVAEPEAAARVPPVAAGVEGASLAVDRDLVERLLAAGHDQWACLADEVEAARLAGHRVIAVAGGERGEGRTTLVACLAAVLRDRGREVVVLGSTAELATGHAAPTDGGRLHDKRIVLVDAGIWFPPGPIRRQRLLVAGLGCDAAILVRRADREPAPARATALAATGVTALGEVVTFAPTESSTASAQETA